MTRCRPCARAIIGVSAEPNVHCIGCRARSLARSEAMLTVMDASKPSQERLEARRDLRERMAKAMPTLPYEAARDAVLAWFLCDHPNHQLEKQR